MNQANIRGHPAAQCTGRPAVLPLGLRGQRIDLGAQSRLLLDFLWAPIHGIHNISAKTVAG
jgi:hypothetical protein